MHVGMCMRLTGIIYKYLPSFTTNSVLTSEQKTHKEPPKNATNRTNTRNYYINKHTKNELKRMKKKRTKIVVEECKAFT